MGVMYSGFNPYWCDNFNLTYPDANGWGSHSHPLYLNYLEHFTTINHLGSDADLWIKCSHHIDGQPGWDAALGSTHDLWVDGYKCDGPSGDYHYAYTFSGLNAEARPTNLVEIAYNPTGNNFQYRPLNDDSTDIEPITDNHEENLALTDIDKHYRDSLLNIVLTDAKPEMLEYLQGHFGINPDGSIDKSHIENSQNGIDYTPWISLYPNPTHVTCYLEYNLFDPSEIQLRLCNTLGQDFSFVIEAYDKQQDAGKYKIAIHSELLSAGAYYCTIKIGDNVITKKLSVY